MSHIVRLVKSEEVARGTRAFYFEKPAGYSFIPGQATDWTLLDPAENDDEGPLRSFSFASAPEDDFLRIATRMRDTAFKRLLGRLADGAEIQMDDPWGEFTLPTDEAASVVLLAGGIGITPFMSMIRHAALRGSDRPITLFYSNRAPQDAPFLSELEALRATVPAARMVLTMTDPVPKEDWSGERGFIDGAMLTRHLTSLSEQTFYIAGPPAMVAAMRTMLLTSGVTEQQIRLDEFLGY